MGSTQEFIVPTVEDEVAVGKEVILECPHVSVGPGRISSAPVPSVFRDDRGEIHRQRVGHRRINQLFSKKGTMRSGYLHNVPMHRFFLSGKVEVWILKEKGTEKTIFEGGQSCTIPPYHPHILYFLEDTILVEWWDGDLQCYFYHPYRRLVNVQNSLVSIGSSQFIPGRFEHLVPQDNQDASQSSPLFGKMLWGMTGVAVGLLAGFVLFGGKQESSSRR